MKKLILGLTISALSFPTFAVNTYSTSRATTDTINLVINKSLSNYNFIASAFSGGYLDIVTQIDAVGKYDNSIVGYDANWYFSYDSIITPNDYLISTMPMYSYTGSFSKSNQSIVLDESDSIPTGSYYLGVIVDPANNIVESNERDNAFTYPQIINFFKANADSTYSIIPKGFIYSDTVKSYSVLPMDLSRENSLGQFLLLNDELNGTDTIQSISFFKSQITDPSIMIDTVTVFMQNTIDTVVSALPINLLENNIVYNGPFNIRNDKGWVTINFETPFIYNHSKNLLIQINKKNSNISIPFDTSNVHMIWEVSTEVDWSKRLTAWETYDGDPTPWLTPLRPIVKISSKKTLSTQVVPFKQQKNDYDLQVSNQNFNFVLNHECTFAYSIVNLQGRIIYHSNVEPLTSGKHIIELRSLDLSKGMYVINIEIDNHKFSHKLNVK